MNVSGLLPYQKSHAEHLRKVLCARGAALDASDTGTGKTFVALALAREFGVVPLIVGPKAARYGWLKAGRCLGVDFEFVNYERARTGWKTENGRRLVSSEWLEERPYGSGSLLRWKNPPEFVIMDEVHRCGGMTSLNSKMLIAAKRQARYVLALSATAADDPRQMKALGFALGLHDLNGRRPFRNWLLRHGCRPGIWGGFTFTDDVVEQRAVFAQIHAELFPHAGARLRRADIPGFPKTRIETRLLDCEGRAAQLTAELHELYQLRRGQADAADGAEEILRRRQELELLKVPAMVELTVDYRRSSRVVCFVNFTDTLRALVEALRAANFSVGQVDGSQTGARGDAERAHTLEEFQANRLDVLVANSQAGGESINAHDACGKEARTTLISPGWSGRQMEQLFGRVQRQGGAFSRQFILLFAGTAEEDMGARLDRKLDAVTTLNEGRIADTDLWL